MAGATQKKTDSSGNGQRMPESPGKKLGGKPMVFWDMLREGPQPVRKPDPKTETAIVRMRRKQMEEILAGIRDSNRTIAQKSFKAAARLLPNLCTDDVVQICKAGIRTTHVVVSSAMNTLADAYIASSKEPGRKQVEGSLVEGIEACERNGRIDRVARLLDRKDLSDAVRRAGEEVLKNG